MNSWYYRSGDQETGPFGRDDLDKLRAANVIDGATPVKTAEDSTWCVFADLLSEPKNAAVTLEGLEVGDARFFYVDREGRAVGPFHRKGVQQLYATAVINLKTLVSARGDREWVPVGEFLGIQAGPLSTTSSDVGFSCEALPRNRSFEHYALMMGITLTFYVVYLIPSNSRDMKAITGRPRMEFTPLLFFGILTLGVLLVVILSLWAFDLERHGNEKATPGRQQSLGAYVLALNILSLVLAFFSGGLALVLSAAVTVAAVWLLQKEINLYAKLPSP